jgi:hypothetical protein
MGGILRWHHHPSHDDDLVFLTIRRQFIQVSRISVAPNTTS